MANWKKIPVPPDATIKILKPDAHSTSGANGSSSTWSTTPRKDTVPRSSRDTMTDRCRPPLTWSITRYRKSNSISTEGTSRSNEKAPPGQFGTGEAKVAISSGVAPVPAQEDRLFLIAWRQNDKQTLVASPVPLPWLKTNLKAANNQRTIPTVNRKILTKKSGSING